MANPTLERELASLLNKHSAENGSNTPDFILAEYMMNALRAFERATKDREAWYGRPLHLGVGPETARTALNGGATK